MFDLFSVSCLNVIDHNNPAAYLIGEDWFKDFIHILLTVYMYINDIPVVTYSTAIDGVLSAGIVTLGDQGGLYNVTLGAAEDDSDFSPIADNIIYSFSATEYEEAETEAE